MIAQMQEACWLAALVGPVASRLEPDLGQRRLDTDASERVILT